MQLQSDLPDASPVIQTAPVVYTRIPDAVLLDARLTPGQLRIYAVIARRADRETATAFPSYSTIAEDAHVSRTSAVNGVKRLVKLGYLSKQARESGQGDPTSNLYTISGEGSQIFVLPRPNTASNSPQAAPNLDHRMLNFVPQAVQLFDRGGANSAPELDSINKKKSNKTQENRIARERTRDASEASASAAAAADDPELQKLLNDFQENIGALTGMAQEVLCHLAEHHGADRVRDAIQEAVIYEKRSLAYVRRVLEAWRRNGRATEDGKPSPLPQDQNWSEFPTIDHTAAAQFFLPPMELDGIEPENREADTQAMAAWNAISSRVPELGRFARVIEPQSLTDNVLTVSVPDERTHLALTNGLGSFMNRAIFLVLGKGAKLQVEIAGCPASALVVRSERID